MSKTATTTDTTPSPKVRVIHLTTSGSQIMSVSLPLEYFKNTAETSAKPAYQGQHVVLFGVIKSIDSRLSFTQDKSQIGIGLRAYRFNLAQEPGLAKTLSKLKAVEG